MDSSFLPTLGMIILAIVSLVFWRWSGPMMARIYVMGATGSLGIWLLQREDWRLVGGGLLGLGVVLLVVNVRADFRDPNPGLSLKHPVMVLGVSTLVMMPVVGLTIPFIDDVRVKNALVIVMVVVAAAFLITTLVTIFRVVREQLRLRERTR